MIVIHRVVRGGTKEAGLRLGNRRKAPVFHLNPEPYPDDKGPCREVFPKQPMGRD